MSSQARWTTPLSVREQTAHTKKLTAEKEKRIVETIKKDPERTNIQLGVSFSLSKDTIARIRRKHALPPSPSTES